MTDEHPNIDAILAHNYKIMASEKAGGMIYEVRRKLGKREIDRSLVMPCVFVEFLYRVPPLFQENEEGCIERFGSEGLDAHEFEQHKSLLGCASYKVSYDINMIQDIAEFDYDSKASPLVQSVIEASMLRFNDQCAGMFQHNANLLHNGSMIRDIHQPFSKTKATRDLNAALREHRKNTAR